MPLQYPPIRMCNLISPRPSYHTLKRAEARAPLATVWSSFAMINAIRVNSLFPFLVSLRRARVIRWICSPVNGVAAHAHECVRTLKRLEDRVPYHLARQPASVSKRPLLLMLVSK